MRILIVEDDFTSRKLMQMILSPHGDCDIAVNGEECVQAFAEALDAGKPYDLVCLDIMMPMKDGHQALKELRALERDRGIQAADECKVIMTTALDDPRNVVEAYYKGGATSYIPKPIDKQMFLQLLRNLELIK